MISAIIPTLNAERALVPTLAALVPGALCGLVREVIIADGGSRDATASVCDIAGCRLLVSSLPVGARLRAAAKSVRGTWLLFLQPGMVPDRIWMEETRRFIEENSSAKPAAVFRAAKRSSMIQSLLAVAIGGPIRLGRGLVISKQLY